VTLEYDGVWHGEVQHVGQDRRRLSRLNDAGWTVVFVTPADLHGPELLVARIARLLVSRSVGGRSSVRR
jgi:G:T-mismatch repair DNA endonuclease (very short patch repair protein)